MGNKFISAALLDEVAQGRLNHSGAIEHLLLRLGELKPVALVFVLSSIMPVLNVYKTVLGGIFTFLVPFERITKAPSLTTKV